MIGTEGLLRRVARFLPPPAAAAAASLLLQLLLSFLGQQQQGRRSCTVLSIDSIHPLLPSSSLHHLPIRLLGTFNLSFQQQQPTAIPT